MSSIVCSTVGMITEALGSDGDENTDDGFAPRGLFGFIKLF